MSEKNTDFFILLAGLDDKRKDDLVFEDLFKRGLLLFRRVFLEPDMVMVNDNFIIHNLIILRKNIYSINNSYSHYSWNYK
jgi:hypothetical protein